MSVTTKHTREGMNPKILTTEQRDVLSRVADRLESIVNDLELRNPSHYRAAMVEDLTEIINKLDSLRAKRAES